MASEASQENIAFLTTLKDIGKVNEKKYIFDRNDVEARASVRTPSYAPGYLYLSLNDLYLGPNDLYLGTNKVHSW